MDSSAPSSDSPPIQIYAELLLNIRTISLTITLQSLSTYATTAVLSANGSSVTVSHDGHSATIRLPTQMQGGGSAALDIPAAPAKELTLRLQLEEKAPGLLRLDGLDGDEGVPWMAGEMEEGVESVRCRSCEAVVVDVHSRVREWRNMPSENWADMMDLWHCHKPHDTAPVGDETSSKGYSAARSRLAEEGIGYVSPSYFLFHESCLTNVGVQQVSC
jgi:ubiquitin-protein ligase E3 D